MLLGPPGTGKTHVATGLGVRACQAGHRVLFATATDWVTRLTDAHRHGSLPRELARLRRYGLIIVDEVGYLPFEQDAANLFFQLVSSRYEHGSLICVRQVQRAAQARLRCDIECREWDSGAQGERRPSTCALTRIPPRAPLLLGRVAASGADGRNRRHRVPARA